MLGCNTFQKGKTVVLVLQVHVSLPQRVPPQQPSQNTSVNPKADPAGAAKRLTAAGSETELVAPGNYSSQLGLTEHTRTDPHLLHS